MRFLPATLLLAASGCAQLFGLDETSGPNVDPSRVSLTMQRWSIGASVSKNPLDLSMQTASFLVDDGAGGFTRVTGELTATDTFSAPILEGTPPVLFTLPEMPPGPPRLWATPSRDRIGALGVFEHPNPQPPLPNSAVMLSATLPSAYVSGESFRIEAIGAWMARGITPDQGPDLGVTTITATMPYSTFGTMTSAAPARITSQDVVLVERYVGTRLTGVYQVPPFDQTDGTDPINATIVSVNANRDLIATVDPGTYSQRFSAVRPAVSGLSQSWTVNAAPGWSLGSNTGPRLLSGSADTTTTMLMTTFGNPFESLDWRSVFQFSATASRTYSFMNVPMTLNAQMSTVAFPGDTAIALDMPAGLPINIRANLVPLSTDGMTVALDVSQPVELDAVTDMPANTNYSLDVYEVALSADMMAVERKRILAALTVGEATFRLPPGVFEVGKYYYVNFRSNQGGYEAAAMGDLQTFTLPYSYSRADSAVFQVVAP